MTPKLKVSICIPTYNGAGRIKIALDSIFGQLNSANYKSVEVVISDNASSDDVFSVVKRYSDSFPGLVVYNRNQMNVGYDRNVNSVFSYASGKYVWLLADDDSLEPDAIDTVLETIEKYNDLKLLQLNFRSYDSGFNPVEDEEHVSRELLCYDAETFLNNAGGRYGQLSTLIFDRCAWIEANVEKSFDTNYVHVYALLKVLLMGKSYVFQRSLVKVRMGSENFGTSGDSLVLVPIGVGEIINQMNEMGYCAATRNRLLSENRRYILRVIPRAKCKGISRPFVLMKKITSVYSGSQIWLIWVPMIFIPNCFYRLTYLFLKQILRLKS